MFRNKIRSVMGVGVALAFLFLATVANAKDKNASKDTSTTLSVMSNLTLGGQAVKPGVYTVKASDNTVALEMNGKTVAQAPAEWKDGTDKAANSTVRSDSGVIKEIHFSGKTQYIVVSETTEASASR